MTQDTKKTDWAKDQSKFAKFTDTAKKWWKKFLQTAAKWVIVSMLAIWWTKAEEWFKWEFKKYSPKEIINDENGNKVKIDVKSPTKFVVYKNLEANFEWKKIEKIVSIVSTNWWFVAYDADSYVRFLNVVNKDVFKKFKPEEFAKYWFFWDDAEVWLKNWYKIWFHLVLPENMPTTLMFIVELDNWDVVEYIKQLDFQSEESTEDNKSEDKIENKDKTESEFDITVSWDDTLKYFNFNHSPNKPDTMYFGLQIELNEKESIEILEIKSLLWGYINQIWKDENKIYLDYHSTTKPDTIIIIWKKDWKKIKIEKSLTYKE